MFLSRVGRADTKGLFASCPHLLGIALGWAPGAAAYASAWASRHPAARSASPCSSESAPKGKDPWVVTFGTG